ncbi:MAG: amino acid permease, partial [Flavobacteriaceae bacterium]|nr:amino acid permease [Flavobacteriaceae bacterium]
IQNYLTIGKVARVAVLILAGLCLGKGNLAHFSEGTPVDFDFSTLKTAGLSLMWIMFAYSGWNASTYVGSEIMNLAKNFRFCICLMELEEMSLSGCQRWFCS